MNPKFGLTYKKSEISKEKKASIHFIKNFEIKFEINKEYIHRGG